MPSSSEPTVRQVRSGKVVSENESASVAESAPLELTSSDPREMRRQILAAMYFPRDRQLRDGYLLRHHYAKLALETETEAVRLTKQQLQALLSLPSWNEISKAAEVAVMQGSPAGDVLALIYETEVSSGICPSERAALKRYKSWALGKRFGNNKDALPLAASTIRSYVQAAKPAIHLWAAFRLLRRQVADDEEELVDPLSTDELPFFLGVAKAIETFATAFKPKTAPADATFAQRHELLLLPDWVLPITPLLSQRPSALI